MDKSGLINAFAEQNQLSKKDAKEYVDGLLTLLQDTLKAGEKISIPGFGTFEVAERKAREGRNPRTGEKVVIAAAKNVKFKAGSNLKKLVNE